MIHRIFVDVSFLTISPLNIHILIGRDSRASSVSADRGRTEMVQTVEFFSLDDLIYYGRGKSEQMTDINIRDSVVLKTESV